MNDDKDLNIVELVKILQEIDENAENTRENEFIIYDKDGNKIYF